MSNETDAQEAAIKSKEFSVHPDYRAFFVGVNVCDEHNVQSMVDAITSEFGRVDCSVNSAGVCSQFRNLLLIGLPFDVL